jgi:hypothetical protein
VPHGANKTCLSLINSKIIPKISIFCKPSMQCCYFLVF